MYLSKLTLNPHSRQAQRELGNPYQLHRTIMSGFPVRLPDEERVLFRLDADARSGDLTLLVQSMHEPDWSPLINADQGRYLRSAPDKPKCFQPDLPAGSLLRFRLRANPTVKKQRDDHKNGNRVPLVREEEQTAWLDRKGEQHGFCVLQVQVTSKDELSGWKKEDDKPHKLQLYMIQFDGVLQVIDSERFAAAIGHGIGPAKGFGCGLLSLARHR